MDCVQIEKFEEAEEDKEEKMNELDLKRKREEEKFKGLSKKQKNNSLRKLQEKWMRKRRKD